MKRTFTISPGIASHLFVREHGVPTQHPDGEHVVYMGEKQGCVVGLRDTPMAKTDLPAKLQLVINNHFTAVFAMVHETWHVPGVPSPRAAYLQQLTPWDVECEE